MSDAHSDSDCQEFVVGLYTSGSELIDELLNACGTDGPAASMSSPTKTNTRPSGSSVAVGYQRAAAMSGPRVHELFAGSKIVVSLIPLFALTCPPTISVLPPAICV